MAELLNAYRTMPACLLAVVLTACGTIGRAEVPDAGDIVLAADAAPAGMSFNGTGEEESALTAVVISGRDAEFRALAPLASTLSSKAQAYAKSRLSSSSGNRKKRSTASACFVSLYLSGSSPSAFNIRSSRWMLPYFSR